MIELTKRDQVLVGFLMSSVADYAVGKLDYPHFHDQLIDVGEFIFDSERDEVSDDVIRRVFHVINLLQLDAGKWRK